MTTLTVNKTKFIDLDLSFARHPVSDDVSKRVDVNAIIHSVRNLIETNKYEVPFHPEISSQVRELLFENITMSTQGNLERVIRYVIENFEPRVIVQQIRVNPYYDNNHIEVTLVFKIVGSSESYNASFFLDRSV